MSHSISESGLNPIVKHEFGPALGLAHFTDPYDLMYPIISTNYPVFSGCSVDAFESIYNGNIESPVECAK